MIRKIKIMQLALPSTPTTEQLCLPKTNRAAVESSQISLPRETHPSPVCCGARTLCCVKTVGRI